MSATQRQASANRAAVAAADSEIEASIQLAGADSDSLKRLFEQHGKRLLIVAARSASPQESQHLLDAVTGSEPEAEQILLEQSAVSGNAALFEHLFNRCPEPKLGTMLRLHAVSGGVEIWKVILAYNHDAINWEIGEHGDALGQAVVKRKPALVRYLLDEGSDVRNSNFVGMPVLEMARGMKDNQEIVDMLEGHAAPTATSRE